MSLPTNGFSIYISIYDSRDEVNPKKIPAYFLTSHHNKKPNGQAHPIISQHSNQSHTHTHHLMVFVFPALLVYTRWNRGVAGISSWGGGCVDIFKHKIFIISFKTVLF